LLPVTFAAIGECMLELSHHDRDLWQMGFAGDTFNTSWYARKILPSEHRVAYVTALGDDPFSARMAAFFRTAGLRTDRIRSVQGRRPGLYAITLDQAERSFTYWRGESAARQLAEDPDWLAGALAGAATLYFSGITLAILAPPARDRLLAGLDERRAAGARVAFDPNYRPALWDDADQARRAMERAYQCSEVVLPSFDDERRLFGDRDPSATAERIAAAGVPEVAVKDGAGPCTLRARGASREIPPAAPDQVVDTTGAGDSFNGAYLAGRILGLDPGEAARLGHAVAAEVIGVRGALADIDGAAALRRFHTGPAPGH